MNLYTFRIGTRIVQIVVYIWIHYNSNLFDKIYWKKIVKRACTFRRVDTTYQLYTILINIITYKIHIIYKHGFRRLRENLIGIYINCGQYIQPTFNHALICSNTHNIHYTYMTARGPLCKFARSENKIIYNIIIWFRQYFPMEISLYNIYLCNGGPIIIIIYSSVCEPYSTLL